VTVAPEGIAVPSLRGYLLGACDRVLAALDESPARDTVTEVRGRLAEDLLRVAVGGRMNAGKSTLVNALLAEPLAATDATECTKLVSWFRYGPVDLVRLRFTDGSARTVAAQPLPAAVAAAGRPAGDISAVEVESSNDVLRCQYTIIDTPGLDSLSGLDDMSLRALRQADVLVYLMPHPGENDVRALEALAGAAAGAGITAVNTIGVLSQVDRLGEGTGDPWPAARRQAAKDRKRLGALVSTIVPVHGLLASTVLGTAFRESDMAALRRLAATDRDVVEAARYTADDFLSAPRVPLEPAERERLLGLLGLYGIGVAVEAVDGGARGATSLLTALRAASGIDDLLAQLERQFVALADPLRARAAIQALDAVTWPAGGTAPDPALTALRTELDAVRGNQRLRHLDLMLSLADLDAGKWAAPPDAAASLARLAAGGSLTAQLGLDDAEPDAVPDALARQIADWRTIENTSGRATVRHARTVREYLESLFSG
jgi:Dynamin family